MMLGYIPPYWDKLWIIRTKRPSSKNQNQIARPWATRPTTRQNRQTIMGEKKISTPISKHGTDIEQGFRCYTDGSKTKEGLGAGFCIMEHGKVKTRAFLMQNHTTVFQSEIHAIRMAVPFIKQIVPKGETIKILCDSQAVIQALANIDTKSAMVLRKASPEWTRDGLYSRNTLDQSRKTSENRLQASKWVWNPNKHCSS